MLSASFHVAPTETGYLAVGKNMNQQVFILEDDDTLRQSLQWMLSSSGFEVQAFDSAEAFLDHYDPSMSGCIVTDMCMPGITGLELQAKLDQEHWSIPVILISAFADVPTAVRSMRAGAIDFIQKPFTQRVLLERIHQAAGTGRRGSTPPVASDGH
jgi:FixJ family two-component response regulator